MGCVVGGWNAGGIERFFSYYKIPDRFSGTPGPLFSGYLASLLGLNLPERKVNHSSPCSAKDENEWR